MAEGVNHGISANTINNSGAIAVGEGSRAHVGTSSAGPDPCPSTRGRKGRESQEGASVTSVSSSQGVQVGSGNVMYNTWAPKSPLDPTSLAALSPRTAMARLQLLSHDELVDLFAAASPGDLTEITRGLLRADEPRSVSILADLNPRKAAELIQSLAADFPWLVDLPRAAEAIISHAMALNWVDDPRTGRLERASQSPNGTNGYVRAYEQGIIYWTERGACALSGEIAEYHTAGGGTAGNLGFPLLAIAALAVSPQKTEGKAQGFEGGTVYSSNHGTYTVSGRFLRSYLSADGVQGWLGFPLSVQGPRDGTDMQRFEGGIIYSSAQASSQSDARSPSTPDGRLPISEEVDAASP